MIEFCSRRRMIAAIIILIGVSLTVLYFENHLPLGHEMKGSESMITGNTSGACPDSAELKLSESCRPCTAHDLKVLDTCKSTGYREVMICYSLVTGGAIREFSRSCPVATSVKERTFWTFQCSTALVGALSYSIVYLRQRRLDRLLLEKVNRQIAAGV